ncbi:glycosyltransferase family 2 protein [Rubellimicrobium aerolatum]|uniref:Glycosyltransferase family 2 protein n=1 Tax=Rubellimicrobium aerolatum TaxID=490979 RepID=A0ABW0SB91_9RHOB|nr:glycosyltransferase family 2 protein [Rubellimicrobium aerolatum]MBP1805419.1 cellulose synthase/poly-beta-1,6-N-acetylglucosamine synthase-like glycosyltransferase [Rubellimicrobium aerolatum]
MAERLIRIERHATALAAEMPPVRLPEPRPARDAGSWLPDGLIPVDPLAEPPEAGLPGRLDPVLALAEGLLPWRAGGTATAVLCADPMRGAAHLPRLSAVFGGPVRLLPAEPRSLAAALAATAGRALVARAETLPPSRSSCRSLPGSALAGVAALALSLLGGLTLLHPPAVLLGLVALAALALVSGAALKLAAVAATLRRPSPEPASDVRPARLPVISLLVPLYHETGIARTLLRRMEALDYPRDLLDLCLIVEDDDRLTRATLEATALPPWARIVEVPEGTLRTKPRALNYALAFARGSILGLYDAEDVPAPDHLHKVALAFARRGPSTACLQGALDYHNHRRNWVARCFTLEYAGWFRVLLPGIQRLGLAVPLGGTTLFLRREALEAVGGWDAHNVTEDADLGLRLARAGYLTEMIPIATQEEANFRPWPWVRQRSRWLKGYAVTWAVHMRDPVRLWRELGPRRFWGVQVMFLGAILQFALAPLLWSFWLLPLGLPHPLASLLPPAVLVALSILFLATQALDIAYACVGARRAGKPGLAFWSPTLMLYFPLATLAVYKALWELAARPFHWDKTEHGIDAAVTPPPAPSPRRDGAAS